MNAVTQIDTRDALTFDGWVDAGRQLAQQRRDVDWAIGDWLATGQQHFADQIEFGFLADALGLAPKRLKAAAEVASKIPPSQRDETLSVEHHLHVATLPAPDAMAILKRAKTEHLTPEQTRIAAVERKAELQPPLIDTDWEQHEMVALARAWNRARRSVRQDFITMTEEANMGDIDA